MLTIKKLTFEYPGVQALDDISFAVAERSITALVGPNGAGKTTLLRCIAALEEPVSGEIMFDGVNVLENPRLAHRNFGYLSDFFGLYDELTAEKCLLYMAMAHGIPAERQKQAVALAAGRVEIANQLGKKAGSLSRGLRQRLAIAQAIIHEPRVLLLDEPASGLDPEARSSLSGLFKSLSGQGMTLIVSSHIIAELEEYSTDMIILKEGKVAGQRAIHDAGGEAPPLLRVSFAGPSGGLPEILSGMEGVSGVRIEGGSANFRFAGDEWARHALLKRLIDHGVAVSSFSEEKSDMQHEYMTAVRNPGGGGEAGA